MKPPFGLVRCRQASELLSRAKENRLSPRERIVLTLHLAICDKCRRYGRQIKLLGRAFRAAADAEKNDNS